MASEKRLIELDAAKKLFDDIPPFIGMTGKCVQEMLDGVPTVDAGEVVLCKECMCCRGVESTENRALECSNPLGLPIITPDTYCAYGERREET